MKINVISLERTPERLAEFRQFNGHLKDAIAVFKAVDGATLSLDDVAARGLIEPPIHYTKGAVGSMISHTSLWEHAAKTGEITTICEDDAIFSFDFARRFMELLTALPDDTDIVYWGWNFDALTAIEFIPAMSAWTLGFGRNPQRSEISAFQNCSSNPVPYRLLRAFGIICYTVTPNGAQRLRQLCLPVRGDTWDFPEIRLRMPNVNMDVAICNALPRIKGFCSVRPLVMSLNERHRSLTMNRPGPT
ncbi:MAG: glycosyltransferase family 25 protein [Steroidobacteraceae bacterium]